jgi:hypothetical protein
MRRGGGGRTCVEETLMEGLIQFKYMRRSGWTRVGGNKGTRPLSIDKEEESERGWCIGEKWESRTDFFDIHIQPTLYKTSPFISTSDITFTTPSFQH